MPERIQRRRVKGWRMPEGAVYVGRPSKWANPFRVGRAQSRRGGPLDMWAVVWEGRSLGRFDVRRDALADAVERYRRATWNEGLQRLEDEAQAELAGKDLACWCGPDDPCHADALGEMANGESWASRSREDGAG